MNKLLAVFFIFLASWGVREVYFSKDSNRDIAYTIIAEQAYVFDVLDKDNVNNFHDFNPTRFIELKKKILISDYDIKDVKQQIKVLDKNEQMLIFALVAIDSIKQGKTKEFNDFILKSYMTMLTLPLIERDLYVYEIIRGLANIDNKLAQEYAVLFLLKQRNSSDKYLHLCSLLYNKHARNKLLSLVSSKEFKLENPLIVDMCNRHRFDIRRRSDEDFEKCFYYTFCHFSMPWTVENWIGFNYPAYSYFAYLSGDTRRYKYYKEKSLSSIQIENMKGGLFEYVEYGVKVFCLTGDIGSAMKLLHVLPEGHKKNLLLKRVARYLSLNRENLLKLLDNNFLLKK